MFIGYAVNHPGDCYRMYDPKTRRVHITRDIIWLKRMYYEKPTRTLEVVAREIEFKDASAEAGEEDDAQAGEDSSQEDEAKAEGENEEEEEFEEAQEIPAPVMVTTTRSGRAVHLPERFQDDEVGLIAATHGSYEISLTAAEEKYYNTMRDLSELDMNREHCLVGAGLGDGFENTTELHVMKYDEAMATD